MESQKFRLRDWWLTGVALNIVTTESLSAYNMAITVLKRNKTKGNKKCTPEDHKYLEDPLPFKLTYTTFLNVYYRGMQSPSKYL